MATTIIIDPGHGGFDSGAVFGQRKEKDDNLRLALATGELLEKAGYHVIYTRTTDQYDSPYEKAQIANNAGGDLFLSFHRNSAERTDLYHGIQALVYDEDPLAVRTAEDINANLANLGFDNLGIEQRKELVVLRRTTMPAVLLEVGFLNSNKDNQLFDEKFDEIAAAIASGVQQALPAASVSAEQLSDDAPSRGPRTRTTERPMQPSEREMDAEPAVQQRTTEQQPSGGDMGTQPMPQPRNTEQQIRQPRSIQMSRPMMRQPRPIQRRQTASPRRPMMTPPQDMEEQSPQQPMQSPQQPMQSPQQPMQSPQQPVRNPVPTMMPSDEPVPVLQPMPIDLVYYVQVGLFRYPENAVYLMEQLKQQGHETVWKRIAGLIAVWVGPVETLADATHLREQLQQAGYDTLIVSDTRQK